jgi:hypothetical protein
MKFHFRENLSFIPNLYYSSRVEVGYSTSTVALRVVGGDEKETLCLGV